MFHKLKKRLVLWYWVTTSIIMTVIMIGAIFVNMNNYYEQERNLFQKNVENIIEKLRSSKTISTAWFADVWNENHIIIYIEENKTPLSYCNQMISTMDAVANVDEVKEYAVREGISFEQSSLYSLVEKSSVFTLKHSSNDANLGMAVYIPTDTGWLNLTAIYFKSDRFGFLYKQIILFTLIDLIGVAALFLTSYLFIGKVLRPLEEGQKKQIAFVAAASHELRSPLTVIKAGLSSIREDASKMDQFLPHIEGECDRMTRLISDMLLLASTDAKTWSLSGEQIDMDTLLIECYDLFCTCYNNRNYELRLDLPEENLYAIYGDRERIKQILIIIVDNAMSYTPSGGEIVLRAYNQKNHVYVEVEDHGAGISDKNKKQVFERFFKGDQSRSDKKHFGLGLSIAKELIELHEGDVFIKDTAGGGATFVLRIPKFNT